MRVRRTARAVLALTAALTLLPPCLPAGADPTNPTPAELKAARDRVAAAGRQVSSLQVQAERAAEAYNGALTRSRAAARRSAQATQQAQAAQRAYELSRGEAAGAQAAADGAAARARRSVAERLTAEAEVSRAQLALNRMASGAFQTGGQLGMVSQLFIAEDPVQLANGQNLINRVGAYQQDVIVQLAVARARATRASAAAESASTQARAAATRAAQALERAASRKDRAQRARTGAATAALDARHAVSAAARARTHALALVARAEAALGTAKQRAARLQQAADEARKAAAGVTGGAAPSAAAATAMHWALKEIGVPYSWGGGDENGPTEGFAQGAGTVGFDCSGLTLFAYGKAGIHLDHWTGSQWEQGKRITARKDLLPGDLMFFAADTSDPATIHHVSLYLGNGRMVEAPYTGEVVRVSSADRSDFIGATRPWAQP